MKNMIRLPLILFLTLVLAATIASVFGQTVNAPAKNSAVQEYALVVETEENRQTKISLSDISRLSRRTVKVVDHGKEATFEGVALVEVLKLGDIEFGDKLRGRRLASFLLVEAADDYRAVLALPEIDPAFTDKLILLADRRDGKPLSGGEGNLRLVVPDEKKQARWMRQIVRLKILRADDKNASR